MARKPSTSVSATVKAEREAAEDRRLDIQMRIAALNAAVAVKEEGASERDVRKIAAVLYRRWLVPPAGAARDAEGGDSGDG